MVKHTFGICHPHFKNDMLLILGLIIQYLLKGVPVHTFYITGDAWFESAIIRIRTKIFAVNMQLAVSQSIDPISIYDVRRCTSTVFNMATTLKPTCCSIICMPQCVKSGS